MPTDGYLRYLATVTDLLNAAASSDQQAAVDTVADLMADAIASGHRIRAFGASHAGLLAQDLMYRAGGLAVIDAVLPAELMLNVRPLTRTTELEQTPGTGRRAFATVTLDKGDVLLLISVSGRNPVIIEAADVAHERGAAVVAVTSLAYSTHVAPRGTRRLFETADFVLDLPGAIGDACITITDGGLRAGPTSSAVGAAVLHGLCVEVTQRLTGRGLNPPVFRSANLDTSGEANHQLIEQYAARVDYLSAPN